MIKLGRLLFSAHDYKRKAKKSCKKTKKTEDSSTKETSCRIGGLCQGKLVTQLLQEWFHPQCRVMPLFQEGD